MSLFTKLFGTSSQRELKSIYPIADKVDEMCIRDRFYVGMTRAKEELILTTAGEPSLFLANLPTTVRRESLTARPAPPAEQLSLF